jgi:tetratricopeptide (TPR) repeat protein
LGWGLGCAPKPKVINIADGKKLQAYGQYEKAIKLFEDFLKQHPESPYAPEARYLIGESYERLNQPQSAMKAYKLVLEKHLKSPYAALSYRQMAKHYAAQGEYEKAIKHYQLAMDVLRSDANIERCTFAIAQIYQNGLKDYEAALKEYRKLTDKELKNKHITVMTYLNMGKIFKQQKEYNKARAAFQTIIDQYPWSAQVTEAKKELERLKP